MQRLFQESLALYGLVIYGLLVWSVQRGMWASSPLCVLAASPLLLLCLRVTLEQGRPGKLIDLVNGSWSFQLGDTFALTTAFAFAAIAFHSVPKESVFFSWQWVLGCAVLGLLMGLLFHAWDSGNYTRDGAEMALYSPTKLAHDFVAYPVLAGALVAVGWPVLYHWSGTSWIVLGCVVIHLVLMGLDGLRGAMGILRGTNLHPGWNPILFQLLAR